jgi:uncharacterized membrane protein YfcA
MGSPWYVYLLAIAAGVLAGIINTLAGSGSLITLPMLLFLGLPPNVANATNRVGVTVQNIVGLATFRQSGRLELTGGLWLVVPAVLGSLLGARIAVDLSEQVMNTAIGVVMVVMLGLILFDPKRWLRQQSEVREGRPSIGALALFFLIGIYGGFIQAGVGVLLLTAMVVGLGYNLVDANVIKLIIVLSVTAVALVVFVLNGQVNWAMGALMAVGQSAGAWLAARFASRHKSANVWVRRLLIVIVVVSILKLFGLLPL